MPVDPKQVAVPGSEIVVVAGSSPAAEAEPETGSNSAVVYSSFGAAEVARVTGSSLTVEMMMEIVVLATETAAGRTERVERVEMAERAGRAAVPNSVVVEIAWKLPD